MSFLTSIPMWLPLCAAVLFLVTAAFAWAAYRRNRRTIRLQDALRQATPVRTIAYTEDGEILSYQDETGIRRPFRHLREVPHLNDTAEAILADIREVFRTGRALHRNYRIQDQYRSADYRLLEPELFGRPAVLVVSQDSSQLQNHIAAAQLTNQVLTKLAVTETFPDAIQSMLRLAGEFTQADRCFVYRIDQLTAKKMFSWEKTGISASPEQRDLLPEPNIVRILQQGEIINVGDLDAPPHDLAGIRLCRQGEPLQSILLTGLFLDGNFYGLIGISTLSGKREFTKNDIRTLRNVAQLYALAHDRQRQRDKLAEETSLHDQVFDKLNVPLILFDHERRVVAINPAGLQLLHHTDAPSLYGTRCDEKICLTRDNSHCASCPLRHTLASGEPCYYDLEQDGRTLRFQTQPIRNPDGSIKYVLENIIDLTEERAQQQALTDVNTRLSGYIIQDKTVTRCMEMMVLETNPDTFFQQLCAVIGEQLQAAGCVLQQYNETSGKLYRKDQWFSANSTANWTQWTEADRNEVPHYFDSLEKKGILHLRFDAPEQNDLPPWKNQLREALLSHGFNEFVTVAIYWRNRFWGSIGAGSSSPRQPLGCAAERMLTAAARIVEVLLEREAGQSALRQSELEKQTILNMLQIPVILFDAQGTILQANPAARKLPLTELPSAAHGESTPGSGEHTIGGRTYRIDTLPIGENDSLRILQSYVDLTEINRSKELLREAAEKAEDAARTKSLFLATMSHEIRTPLNAVIGFSELLQSDAVPPDKQKDYLKSINYAGNALLHLINDILDLSKIDADRMELHQEPTQVDVLLEELMSIFRHSAEEKSLVLTLQRDLSFPLLKLDAQRLRQVLLNIVGNAIKFTERGGVTLRATFRETAHGSGMLSIEAEDTGIGIAKINQKCIFEPFVREEAAKGKRSASGTGLGLAIAQRLVERMGGIIALTSEPGKGSTFSIELPNVEICHEPPKPEMTLALEPNEAPSSSLRVLVVDDVELNVQVMAALVRKLHIHCETATSGTAALNMLLPRIPDVIFTDLWMPGMNGMELARTIRENPAFDKIRLIAVTADTNSEHSFDTHLFDTVLVKPVSLETMRKCLAVR